MIGKVLVACEKSQAVTIEFRKRGIAAFSNDIDPCTGGYPEWHIQTDVGYLLAEAWDMVIAFPPCTHLAVSGAKHFEQKRKDGRQKEGIDFFLLFTTLKRVKRVAIENPIGIMSTIYRKPDQIIQPYQFGDPYTKTTCLWLKGLPVLKSSKLVDKGERQILKSGKTLPVWYSNAKHADRGSIRSKTFPGIAEAMADQWGAVLKRDLLKNLLV